MFFVVHVKDLVRLNMYIACTVYKADIIAYSQYSQLTRDYIFMFLQMRLIIAWA